MIGVEGWLFILFLKKGSLSLIKSYIKLYKRGRSNAMLVKGGREVSWLAFPWVSLHRAPGCYIIEPETETASLHISKLPSSSDTVRKKSSLFSQGRINSLFFFDVNEMKGSAD